ncbi:MAG: tyrosine-protein phosphatase [Defluviitaleaceae bacterium]|nr:tyrosine-protein phosphatase [Defluviitaleaceae bacterium]
MNKLINFRCIGGVGSSCGRTVKRGLLLRSGQLTGLFDEDTAKLKSHGISVVVDLRTAPEISGAPNDDFGAQYINIDILEAGTERFINREGWIQALNPAQAVEGMLAVYEAFVDDPTALQAFGRFLHTLADAPGPVLFHCFAGKDRTGFAAALILKILGVSMECVMKDYMLTVEERKEDNARHIAQYREKGMSEEQLEGLEIAYTVQPLFLESTFEKINEKFGDFDNFIKKGLGASQDLLEKLKEKYLES